MKTFKMYVKTVIYNEKNELLLLNEINEDSKPSWDLPGAPFTEEQSFDETVINKVQKEIGYYVYPGKIIGIADYSNNVEKEVNVVMEGNILNGDLLLSKKYETHTWVSVNRITDYPLAPWLNNYMKNNQNPFGDIEADMEGTNRGKSERNYAYNNINTGETGAKINNSVKSSFSILKDTIIRTFRPQEAKVTKTEPKTSETFMENKNEDIEDENIANQLNINFNKEEEEIYAPEIILNDNKDDIIIEHDDADITSYETTEESNNNIEDLAKEEETIPKTKPKIFDMNINKTHNMKKSIDKIKKPIKKINNSISSNKEQKIKIIHEDEKRPHIRKEKESTEKFSFNSENIKRYGWKESLNKLNRTEANNHKKQIPRPKGQRK